MKTAMSMSVACSLDFTILLAMITCRLFDNECMRYVLGDTIFIPLVHHVLGNIPYYSLSNMYIVDFIWNETTDIIEYLLVVQSCIRMLVSRTRTQHARTVSTDLARKGLLDHLVDKSESLGASTKLPSKI